MGRWLSVLLMGILASTAAFGADVQGLVKGITDPSADVRAEAWKSAGPAGAEAVAPLAQQLTSENPEIMKAAACALDNIVDYVCTPANIAGKDAVAAELAKLLDPAQPLAVRTEAVRLLAMCGGDAEAPAVAALLTDADEGLAMDAVLTLDRIPGDGATQALIAALPKVQVPAVARRAAAVLGHRGSAAAVPVLKETVASGKGPVKWASLDALARLGVPPAEAMPRNAAGNARQLARWDDARLDAAAALAATGDARAAQLYVEAARESEADRQVATALLGLRGAAADEFVPLALQAINRPGARMTAVEILTKDGTPETDALLAKAFADAKAVQQSAIVEVFAARKAAALGDVLPAAKSAKAPEVRLAAAQAAGEVPSQELLLETIDKGSDLSKRQAAALLLATAVTAEGNDAAAAQGLYETIIRSKTSSVLKREAFAGLERMARIESLALLNQFVGPLFADTVVSSNESHAFLLETQADSGLLAAAGRAYVVVTAMQAKDAAVPVLKRVLQTEPPSDVQELAVQKLAEFGVDPQAPTQ